MDVCSGEDCLAKCGNSVYMQGAHWDISACTAYLLEHLHFYRQYCTNFA